MDVQPANEAALQSVNEILSRARAEVAKVIIGQQRVVDFCLIAVFTGNHILIEGVPGVAKTLLVRTLAKVLGADFSRIQFTPDLMPSDITGTSVFNLQEGAFHLVKGPIFTSFLLADEINRAPAKTHAALLEIMQEYRVTIDGVSHPVPTPFLVLATQNPLESEGTYNLPEAQLDRFMFKLFIDYPTAEEEAEILKMHSKQIDLGHRLEKEIRVVTGPDKVREMIKRCGEVLIADPLVDYINRIVRSTRGWPAFHLGASPRAGIALMQAARTQAAFAGRDFAVPDDVVRVALPALRHRVQLTAEAEVEGRQSDDELRSMIEGIDVPRD